MYGRTVPSALRGLGRLNGSSASSGPTCMRSFSTTPSFGIRAIYSETDNTELNSILGEIQEKIILPAYLPQKQRSIVFDPTKRMYLEQNPIDIEVEGHEHRFATIDKAKDIPKTRPILWKALRAMQSSEDWDNLGTLLAGFRRAGINLTAGQQGKLLRLATEAGQLAVIIECLKQAQKTGLYIVNKEQFARVFIAVCVKIDAAAGDVAEVRQATRWAEIALDLVQRPENLKRIAAAQKDSRTLLNFSIMARSMLLYARASLVAAKQAADEPFDDDMLLLKDEVALVRTLWAPHIQDGVPIVALGEIAELLPKNAQQVMPEDMSAGAKNSMHALCGSGYVKSLGWTIRAIRIAEQIVPEEAAPLKPLVDSIDKHVSEVLNTMENGRERWGQEYSNIVGSNESS